MEFKEHDVVKLIGNKEMGTGTIISCYRDNWFLIEFDSEMIEAKASDLELIKLQIYEI